MYLLSFTTLKKVIEEGSYSKAAAALFISQPSASQHIRQLERMFGAKLVQMSGRHAELTDAGKPIYELACKIESELEVARQRVDDALGRSQRLVTIASNTSPLLHRLPSVIKHFWYSHPEVEIKTLKKSAVEITDSVKAGVADIGIQTALHLDSTLEALPLWKDWVVAVVAPDHPIARNPVTSADETARERVVVTVGREIRELLDNWFESRGLHLHNVMEVSSFEQVRAAALEGLGVGFLPSYVITNDLASGALVQVDIRDLTISRNTYVIFKRNVREPVRWLIDEMVDSVLANSDQERVPA
ncbi:MAG TPA: LysR family transcriptional regulator [Dehalococcoidia bacterium]|nr:LysR family transcriptional regulator [Dehalococcoidia bacterium]